MAQPGAVGRLIAATRHRQQPRWSQAFLAGELTRRGFPVARNQIARLELSAPNRHNALALTVAAHVLAIEPSAVLQAIASDYWGPYRDVTERLDGEPLRHAS